MQKPKFYSNHIRSFQLLLKLSFLFITLTILNPILSTSQTVILDGTILTIDQQALEGVSIEYEEKKGVITDQNGKFKLNLENQKQYTLKVRSLGFIDLDTTIIATDKQPSIVLTLRKQTYVQPEIVVTEKINTLFKQKDLIVKDLVVQDGQIYTLYLQNNKRYLSLSNLKGIQLSKILLDKKYNELYKSCSDRLYLKSKKELIETSSLNKEIKLSQSKINIDDFNKFMAPCMDKLKEQFIFKKFSDHNKRVSYFKYDQEKKQQLLYQIFDTDAFQVVSSYYYEIIAMYAKAISQPEPGAIDEGIERENMIRMGEWSGDLIDLVINNEILFAVSYYQNVEARAFDTYEFKHKEKLYIVNTIKKEIIAYSSLSMQAQKISMNSEFKWDKLKKVLYDKKAKRIFLLLEKNKIYELIINKNKASIKAIKNIEGSWKYKKALQIYDGNLYYFYQPNLSQLNTAVIYEPIN